MLFDDMAGDDLLANGLESSNGTSEPLFVTVAPRHLKLNFGKDDLSGIS